MAESVAMAEPCPLVSSLLFNLCGPVYYRRLAL